MACDGQRLLDLAEALTARPWAPDQASWSTLAAIDNTLLRLGLVPRDPKA